MMEVVCAFDTETTGFVNPRLVELGFAIGTVSSAGTVLLHARSLIVKPAGFDIPEESTKIHGISTARALAEGCDVSHALAALKRACKAYGVDRIIAHNLAYDAKVMRAERDSGGGTIPLCCEVGGGAGSCTLAMARSANPGSRLGNNKLATVHARLYGEGAGEGRAWHGAEVDAVACLEVYTGFSFHSRGSAPASVPASVPATDEEVVARVVAVAFARVSKRRAAAAAASRKRKAGVEPRL